MGKFFNVCKMFVELELFFLRYFNIVGGLFLFLIIFVRFLVVVGIEEVLMIKFWMLCLCFNSVYVIMVVYMRCMFKRYGL